MQSWWRILMKVSNSAREINSISQGSTVSDCPPVWATCILKQKTWMPLKSPWPGLPSLAAEVADKSSGKQEVMDLLDLKQKHTLND